MKKPWYIKILGKEYVNMRGAVKIFLNRTIKKGDEIGFRIGKRHYFIKRDK